jgi:hypothetical protein
VKGVDESTHGDGVERRALEQAVHQQWAALMVRITSGRGVVDPTEHQRRVHRVECGDANDAVGAVERGDERQREPGVDDHRSGQQDGVLLPRPVIPPADDAPGQVACGDGDQSGDRVERQRAVEPDRGEREEHQGRQADVEDDPEEEVAVSCVGNPEAFAQHSRAEADEYRQQADQGIEHGSGRRSRRRRPAGGPGDAVARHQPDTSSSVLSMPAMTVP